MTDITRTLNDEGIASPKGKLWGKTSVDAILINEAYTGTLLWGMNAKDMADPVRLEKAFPAIVTKAQFRRVNDADALPRIVQQPGHGITLRRARRATHPDAHQQPVAILHQRMAHEHQLGLLPLASPCASATPQDPFSRASRSSTSLHESPLTDCWANHPIVGHYGLHFWFEPTVVSRFLTVGRTFELLVYL